MQTFEKKNFNLVSPCNTKPLTIYRKEGLKNLLPFFTALCGTPKTELEPQVRPLLPILQFLSKLRFFKKYRVIRNNILPTKLL